MIPKTFNLDGLLQHRLIVVSGKGGVGKTTVCLALGLLAAESGRRTLVAEINSEEPIAHLLERPPIGYEETELLPNLWAINIHPRRSFEEYVLNQIKFRSLYKAVFENRFIRHFIDATPGLADLMCIGKVYSLSQRYDLVVVDAPATGHSVALFEIPSIVSTAVKVGPLQTESDKIDRLLHDREQTSVVVVTLPEEMPVLEGIEMRRTLEQRLSLPVGPVFLNQFHEPLFTLKERSEIKGLEARLEEPVWNAIDLQIRRADLSAHYEEVLKDCCQGTPIVRIPFLYTTRFALNEIEAVASLIEEAST